MLVPADNPNLFFLPGDGMTPLMANMAYAQKVKLILRVRKLPADYILLDLGAGSSFNTLDFFRLSPHGVLVTTPEPTAVMGMFVFMKNFLLRAIEREMVRNYGVKEMLRELGRRPMAEQAMSIKEVQRKIANEDPGAGAVAARILQRCCASVQPRPKRVRNPPRPGLTSKKKQGR